MNHQAIYALYPQVVSIDDGIGALDANGNRIQIDMSRLRMRYQRRDRRTK